MKTESKRSALPYGLMRLSDMINFDDISVLGKLFDDLRRNRDLLMQISFGRDEWMTHAHHIVCDETKRIWRDKLSDIEIIANKFELDALIDRVSKFNNQLNDCNINYATLYQEAHLLKEMVHDGMNRQYLYRYPTDKAKILLSWKKDWATVTSKFPSAEKDIIAGVDLWALGHSTASVFHMMRVLERGLEVLSLYCDVAYTNQTWGKVIDQIEKKIQEKKSLPNDEDKSKKLQFLSEAAKEFVNFKNGWRNYVSHNKCVYDEYQARSVMEHVRQFMTTLGREFSEASEQESGVSSIQTVGQSHLHQAPERSQ